MVRKLIIQAECCGEVGGNRFSFNTVLWAELGYCERVGVSIESQFSYEKRIRDFEVRNDDVYVVSFPKCGTTWTQEMVWNICNGCDVEKAKSLPLVKRMPFIEISGLLKDNLVAGMSEEAKKAMPEAADSVNNASNMPRNEPRLLKTHVSYDMLPEQVREKKPKIIYVTRNPRDAVVSFYNHWKALCGFTGRVRRCLNKFGLYT